MKLGESAVIDKQHFPLLTSDPLGLKSCEKRAGFIDLPPPPPLLPSFAAHWEDLGSSSSQRQSRQGDCTSTCRERSSKNFITSSRNSENNRETFEERLASPPSGQSTYSYMYVAFEWSYLGNQFQWCLWWNTTIARHFWGQKFLKVWWIGAKATVTGSWHAALVAKPKILSSKHRVAY